MLCALAFVAAARTASALEARIGDRDIPDPTSPANLAACHIERAAAVCDPDAVFGVAGVLSIASVLADARRSTTTVCGGGVQIGVAAVLDGSGLTERGAVAAAASVIDAWGVGDAECDDGVAIVLAVVDRKVGIKTGPGATAALTDAEIQRIIAAMRPALREGDYTGAVLGAIARIVDELTRPAQARDGRRSGGWHRLATALLGAWPLLAWAAIVALTNSVRRRRQKAQLRRIDQAFARGTPNLALPSAAGPACDVCLRAPPAVPAHEVCTPLVCGHTVCAACRWRFGGLGVALGAAGWSGVDAQCPVCAKAAELRLVDGDDDGRAGLPGGTGSAKRARGAARRLEARRLRREADEALYGLRMASLTSSRAFRTSHGAPAWAEDGAALAANQPWVSDASRELLSRRPGVIRPPEVPPLGPSSGGWSAEQTDVARRATDYWLDVRRQARHAASPSAVADGWANMPADAADFGGGSSGSSSRGGGGGGGGGGGSW